jgi:hypothetical protein
VRARQVDNEQDADAHEHVAGDEDLEHGSVIVSSGSKRLDVLSVATAT